MNIGEKIYELRKAKGLSQGELADMLEVSRQSVSKWETCAAVPELDKLIKLCDVFDVSLDELTGRNAKIHEPNPMSKEKSHESESAPAKSTAITQQTIVGYILLVFSLLAFLILLLLSGEILLPVLAALPVLVCSVICLTVERRAVYWCAWTAYGTFELLLGFLTGLTAFSPAVIVVRIIAAVGLAFAAWRSFRDEPAEPTKRRVRNLAIGWVGFVLLATAATGALYARANSATVGQSVVALLIAGGSATFARAMLYRQTARCIAGRKQSKQ